MKKVLLSIVAISLFSLSTFAQTKKDGTPDMRYKSNKQANSNTYKTPVSPVYTLPKPTQRNYTNGGQYKIQNGYPKSNGTYVAPHLKTKPDNVKWNNYKPPK